MSANPLYAELDAINAKLTQAIASQEIDSLEAARSAIGKCVQYLSDRDDCWDEHISKAIDYLVDADHKLLLQEEDIEDGSSTEPTADEDMTEQLAAFVRANKPVERTR